ncbi:MAG TPA: GH1 family beta-glucosidase [Ilumatobacteraceae bacterium]|nr:GH1 family beta-glucosidase [Ilumatobacteraceae bacterium]
MTAHEEPASTLEAGRRFPSDFLWGSATSAYQIEGAATDDGRGESIWDRFCSRPGVINDGSSGAVACDHYHRFGEDIAMMQRLNFNAYRFSIAWPRIFPEGRGKLNERGLDFYERLVDQLLAHGLRPLPTLYHWDLPQTLEDAGGWPVRATAEAFAEYAEVVAARLGDRVGNWMTMNEPFVIANHGYLTGEHAPGRSSLGDALATSHHVLLGHGLAMERIRAVVRDANVGIVLNFTPVTPIGSSPAAVERQRIVDDIENRWYVEPVGGRGYPQYTVDRLGWDQSEVQAGDMDLIARPIDTLGVNFYTRKMVGALEGEQPGRGDETAMGWEIHPSAFGDLLRGIHDRHRFPRYLITENGAAMPDTDRVDGRIIDNDRLEYFAAHLAQVHQAMEDGVPVEGYFAWSLLDNFEWAHGYGPKFGLVEVDLTTQRRTPKQSALWYAKVAKSCEILQRFDV